jgi:hypothetical protein
MDPFTVALIAGVAILAATGSQGAYGQGSTRYLLTPGTYRLRFRAAKPQTADLGTVWAIPHVTMSGTGASTRFESLTVDAADPSYWWFTGLLEYAGAPKTIDLLPDMSLVKLS